MLTREVVFSLVVCSARSTNAFTFFSSTHNDLQSCSPVLSTKFTPRIYAADTNNDCVSAEDLNTIPCGEGFYPRKGEDGDVCVFDYDAAANMFSTTQKEGITCNANEYWEELEAKNAVRAKFGLEALTPEQYVVLQSQIQELEVKAKKEQDAIMAKAKAIRESDANASQLSNTNNALSNLMGNIFKDNTCESNYDCDRPEVCCDFGFLKTCCEGGKGGKTAKDLYHEYTLIPVPLGVPQSQ